MSNLNTAVQTKGDIRFPVTELMLLMVAIFWGTSYGLTKEALVYTSVLAFIAIRFSVTFLCLLPIVIRDFSRGLNRDWASALPTGGILSTIFFCEVYGVFHTSASKAAFIISLSVILTAFLEPIINHKRLSGALFFMAFTSVLGVLCLTSSSQLAFSLSFNKGDCFILTAALLRALMVTTTKRFTVDKSITTSTLTAIQSLVVAVIAIAAAIFYQPNLTIPSHSAFWLMIAYLVAFCTLFAFYVQNYAVRRTSPTRVSILMGSEPLFGALFAIVWLNESLSLVQMIGGALIIVSVVVTSLQKTETVEKQE